MGSYAFSNCKGLTSVVLGTRESIPENAFSGCTGLVSVSLPEGLESIGRWAFENCTSLVSVELPDSITTMSAYVFKGCSKLNSINYPENWTTKDTPNYNYADSPFYGCPKLTSIVIPEGVTAIPAYAFHNCGIISMRTTLLRVYSAWRPLEKTGRCIRWVPEMRGLWRSIFP